MTDFDFEKMYTFWSLKESALNAPSFCYSLASGRVYKLDLINRVNFRPFSVFYNKLNSGGYQMLYIEIATVSVSDTGTGELSYYADNYKLYDDEAWEELNSV